MCVEGKEKRSNMRSPLRIGVCAWVTSIWKLLSADRFEQNFLWILYCTYQKQLQIFQITIMSGECGGAVGGGTALPSRKVAVSITHGVFGIFYWRDPSGRAKALGSIRPLSNEYREYFPGGGVKCGRCIRLTILPTSCADSLKILGASVSFSGTPESLKSLASYWFHFHIFI